MASIVPPSVSGRASGYLAKVPVDGFIIPSNIILTVTLVIGLFN